MKPLRVKCPKCGTPAAVPLSPKLAAVLEQVPKNGYVDAPGVAEALRIKSTAVNMRLEKLRGMRLLRRRREGLGWLYFLPTCNNR